MALCEEALHVALHQQRVGQPSEHAERARVVEHVDGVRDVAFLPERVVVVEAAEHARHHRIAEVPRPVERHHAARQPPAQAEVARRPGHRLPEFEQARRAAGDRAFAGAGRRRGVRVDAAAQVEDAFDRRADRGLDLDYGHSVRVATEARAGPCRGGRRVAIARAAAPARRCVVDGHPTDAFVGFAAAAAGFPAAILARSPPRKPMSALATSCCARSSSSAGSGAAETQAADLPASAGGTRFRRSHAPRPRRPGAATGLRLLHRPSPLLRSVVQVDGGPLPGGRYQRSARRDTAAAAGFTGPTATDSHCAPCAPCLDSDPGCRC